MQIYLLDPTNLSRGFPANSIVNLDLLFHLKLPFEKRIPKQKHEMHTLDSLFWALTAVLSSSSRSSASFKAAFRLSWIKTNPCPFLPSFHLCRRRQLELGLGRWKVEGEKWAGEVLKSMLFKCSNAKIELLKLNCWSRHRSINTWTEVKKLKEVLISLLREREGRARQSLVSRY